MLLSVTKSCPTLCDLMDGSLLGSSVHGVFPGKNTGVGCHFLLQGIFPDQADSLPLNYQGSPERGWGQGKHVRLRESERYQIHRGWLLLGARDGFGVQDGEMRLTRRLEKLVTCKSCECFKAHS